MTSRLTTQTPRLLGPTIVDSTNILPQWRGVLRSLMGSQRLALYRFRCGESARTICLLLLCLCPTTGWSKIPHLMHLLPTQHEYDVGSASEYYKDPDGKLTIDEVIKRHDTLPWRPVKATHQSFGFTDAAYWFHFDILDEDQDIHRILLEIHYPLLDWVNIYLVTDGKVFQSRRLGDSLPFADRPLAYRSFLLPMNFPEGKHVAVYVRVRTEGAMQVPILLWHEHMFYPHEQKELLIHGLYFGAIAVFALYNLFLFFSVREAAYLYYVLYMVTFALFQASLSGLGYQHLWPHAVRFQHYSIPLFMILGIFFALRFSHHFLELKRNCPKGIYLVRAISILAPVLLLSLFWLPYALVTQAGLLLTIVTASLLLVLSFSVWRKGQPEAGNFLLAWSVFLLAVIISSLDKLGVTHLGFVSNSILQLGVVVQISLLSLTLAIRINKEKRQRIEAQQQTLQVQQQANIRLEHEVQERTLELEQAMEELEQANCRLDAISRTDGLTGLKNRRFCDEELERQFRNAVRNHSPLSLAMLDIDLFKRINDEYGHPVGDDFLRLIAATIMAEVRRPLDSACRYGGEEFLLILPDTPREGATTVAECIRQAVESLQHKIGDQIVPITISIGVATLTPGKYDQAERLLQFADEALYQAKAQGRNRVVSC